MFSFMVYLILAWYTPKTYSNTLNATLDEQTKIFISEISQMPMEETGGIFDNFLDYQNVDRMELFEENGNRINLPTERSADNDVVIETKAWGNEDNNAPIISNSYTVSFLGKNTNYTLVVYGAAGQVAELQRAFQKVFPLLAFIVFCVSLVTGWIFSHLITKPVLKISRISKEMSELQFEWQLDEQRTDELGILAKSLNYLSQKLNVTLNDLQAANRKLELDIEHEKALEQARTNFFSAVSHELKTPLTSISGYAEIMKNGLVKPEDMKTFSERIYNEASRLITLVEDIMKLSKLDEGAVELEKEEVDFYALTREICSRLAPQAENRHVRLEVTGESVNYHGVRQVLEEMLYNMIENAIKYNKESGLVSVWVGNTL